MNSINSYVDNFSLNISEGTSQPVVNRQATRGGYRGRVTAGVDQCQKAVPRSGRQHASGWDGVADAKTIHCSGR